MAGNQLTERRFTVVAFLAGIWFVIGPSVSGVAVGDERSDNIKAGIDFDVVDFVPALSVDKAVEFEAHIKEAYSQLSPSVVRLYPQDEGGQAVDENGFSLPKLGGVSGVIIDRAGLILTCSHHDLAPDTEVTIELADGKQVAGEMLGRFRLDDPRPMHAGPDLGLARITEPGEWPSAKVEDAERIADGQVCLAIGYPGTLRPGRPPLLRVGRIALSLPGSLFLTTTTSSYGGDSGGPLFDLSGRVVGIAIGGDKVGPTHYESVSVLKEFRERLESGEIVSAARKLIRTLRARPAHQGAFVPLPDLETRVLRRRPNVIRIMDGPHAIAAGLIIDANGLAVTKASLVGTRQEWSCRLFYLDVTNDKAIVKGRVIAESVEHDVALMKLSVQEWTDAPWSEERPVVGTIVSSPLGRSAGPVQFSVVGAETSDEPNAPNAIPQIPLSVEPNEEQLPVVKQTSGWVTAEFDTYRELLRPGDVITHLNGMATPSFSEFGRVMDRLVYASHAEKDKVDYNLAAPRSFHGEWVRIGIRRGAATRTIQVPKVHSVTQGGMSWYFNPLSLRRDALPVVFAHDAQIRPEQCGGPVVDLKGRVVGLNIARADTTRTLAIPADVLQEVIAELKQQATDVVE